MGNINNLSTVEINRYYLKKHLCIIQKSVEVHYALLI